MIVTTTVNAIPMRCIRGSALPPIGISRTSGDREWFVLSRYEVVEHVHGETLVIEAGTRTDLASIPRLAWPIIAPWELSLIAPVVHDDGYRRGGLFLVLRPDGGLSTRRYTRAETDWIFADFMEHERVPRWRRALANPLVRRFGASAWRG